MPPDAVPSVELMANEGAAPVPESFSDVGVVVPKEGIPALKAKSLSSTLLTTAAPVASVMAAEILLLAT